jgi:hypothetical protein
MGLRPPRPDHLDGRPELGLGDCGQRAAGTQPAPRVVVDRGDEDRPCRSATGRAGDGAQRVRRLRRRGSIRGSNGLAGIALWAAAGTAVARTSYRRPRSGRVRVVRARDVVARGTGRRRNRCKGFRRGCGAHQFRPSRSGLRVADRAREQRERCPCLGASPARDAQPAT